jgi:SAM-dependent methyltransferase
MKKVIMNRVSSILMIVMVCSAQSAVALAQDIFNTSYIDYEKIMFELFAKADAKLSEEERAEISALGSSPVYGEIVYESIEYLLQEIEAQESDVFYDLGCGLGRFVVQAYLTTDITKSVGIELSKTRFEQAQAVLDKTRTIYKNCFTFDNSAHTTLKKSPKKKIKNKTIDFICDDILEVDFSDATIIYIALTLNSDEFKNKLNEKIVQLADGLRVLSLHELNHEHLHHIRTYEVPMTWSGQTPVYFYVLERNRIEEAEEVL